MSFLLALRAGNAIRFIPGDWDFVGSLPKPGLVQPLPLQSAKGHFFRKEIEMPECVNYFLATGAFLAVILSAYKFGYYDGKRQAKREFRNGNA